MKQPSEILLKSIDLPPSFKAEMRDIGVLTAGQAYEYLLREMAQLKEARGVLESVLSEAQISEIQASIEAEWPEELPLGVLGPPEEDVHSSEAEEADHGRVDIKDLVDPPPAGTDNTDAELSERENETPKSEEES